MVPLLPVQCSVHCIPSKGVGWQSGFFLRFRPPWPCRRGLVTLPHLCRELTTAPAFGPGLRAGRWAWDLGGGEGVEVGLAVFLSGSWHWLPASPHLCGLCDPQVTTLGIAIRIVGEYDSCRVLSAVIVFYSTTLQSYNYVEKLHVES